VSRDYSVFSDESCISNHRYMLVGSVQCRTDFVVQIEDAVEEIARRSRFPQDSLQWKRLNRHKITDYQAILDLFFELNAHKKADFLAIVIDTQELDHKRHNDGDAEVFFQKMINRMVCTVSDQYYPPRALRCFHGRRDSRFSLEEIKNIINSTIASRENDVLFRPLRQLEYRDVSRSRVHQLNDVLLGCVAYHWNEKMRHDPSSPRSQIASYANRNAPKRLDTRSFPNEWHFNIWPIRLGGART